MGTQGGTSRVTRHAEEYEDVFRDVFPRLAVWAGGLVGDDDAGRDIAAESFARLLARRASTDDPVPYLYKIALNQIRDRWRHQQVVDRTAYLVAVPESSLDPDLSVRDVVDRLPSKLRDPLVLHYFADLPVAQVAEILGRPVGTVTKRLTEGRNTLRLQLENA